MVSPDPVKDDNPLRPLLAQIDRAIRDGRVTGKQRVYVATGRSFIRAAANLYDRARVSRREDPR